MSCVALSPPSLDPVRRLDPALLVPAAALADVAQPQAAAPRSIDHLKVRELIGMNYSRLIRYLRRRVQDQELAADLVHHAVAITLEQLQGGRLAHGDSLAGYVFNVSVNLLRNHRRRMADRGDLHVDCDSLSDAAASLEMSLDGERMGLLLRDVLASMSIRDRIVITRFYLEEDDKTNICSDLGLSAAQFDVVVSRARRRMREKLEWLGLAVQVC